MEFSEVLFKRRSIRKYEDRDVSEDKMKKLIRAGKSAPSANNKQPWHFVVIRSEETRRKIMDIHPYSSMLAEAPAAISVCGNIDKSESYWVQDCSAATQNILLMAENLGLGAVWLGLHPRRERREEVADMLDLPENIRPLNIIAVGHPAESSHRVDRYDPDKVHYENW